MKTQYSFPSCDSVYPSITVPQVRVAKKSKEFKNCGFSCCGCENSKSGFHRICQDINCPDCSKKFLVGVVKCRHSDCNRWGHTKHRRRHEKCSIHKDPCQDVNCIACTKQDEFKKGRKPKSLITQHNFDILPPIRYVYDELLYHFFNHDYRSTVFSCL
ncbi:hypothetical protein RB653_010580 [Dictyostelium firmibasis]|uniref:Uncharacterized protein n=1 Tax=Dictyostelium firmibasis TaxID=79012 RepID=A0AAN7TT33_9MYCE